MTAFRIILSMVLSLMISFGNAQIKNGSEDLSQCQNCLIEKSLFYQYSIESTISDNELVFQRLITTQTNSKGKPVSISNYDEENNMELNTQYFYNDKYELIRTVENWAQLPTVKITTIEFDAKRNIQTEESVKRMKSDTTIYLRYHSLKTSTFNDNGEIESIILLNNNDTTYTSTFFYDRYNKLIRIETYENSERVVTTYEYDSKNRIKSTNFQNEQSESIERTQYDYMDENSFYLSYYKDGKFLHKDKHISKTVSGIDEIIIEEPHLNRKRIYRTKEGSI